jgi:hypothetical protein
MGQGILISGDLGGGSSYPRRSEPGASTRYHWDLDFGRHILNLALERGTMLRSENCYRRKAGHKSKRLSRLIALHFAEVTGDNVVIEIFRRRGTKVKVIR